MFAECVLSVVSTQTLRMDFDETCCEWSPSEYLPLVWFWGHLLEHIPPPWPTEKYSIPSIYSVWYTKILEVNLFAFAYRLFRRDFSPQTTWVPLVIPEYIWIVLQCMIYRQSFDWRRLRLIVLNSSVWRQKGLTGYCFKYIDRPFCLQAYVIS